MAEVQDKKLVCKECSQEFEFTVSEQKFYKEKGFENEPTRCPDCRAKRKKSTMGGRMGGGSRDHKESVSVTCSDCGKETQVPFKPVQGKPVYCRECYQTKKAR